MVAVLLVRHADIDLPARTADPSLNRADRERAEAQVAAEAGITAIFTSALLRSKQNGGATGGAPAPPTA